MFGYNEQICDLIGQITTVSHSSGFKEHNFVPQGAPTSGAICNIVANTLLDKPVQQYLTKANKKFGTQFKYTRYADDLTISCPKELKYKQRCQFLTGLHDVINNTPYKLNYKKTRTTPFYKQRRMLGIVINRKMNCDKKEYRTLRAILHNCVHKGGFVTQFPEDTDHHIKSIRGRINWIYQINKTKGAYLLQEFEKARQKTS
jgi:RNA-directed DNA polymerase